MGDFVLLSTTNLRVKNVPAKLRRKFVGPFEIVDKIGPLVYKLKLPDTWKIHNVFHVSLLKPWNQSLFSAAQQQVVPELEEPEIVQYYETEKIIRWHWVGQGRRRTKEYLVLWQDQPVEEMSWVPEANFPDKAALQQDLDEDKPEEAPSR